MPEFIRRKRIERSKILHSKQEDITIYLLTISLSLFTVIYQPPKKEKILSATTNTIKVSRVCAREFCLHSKPVIGISLFITLSVEWQQLRWAHVCVCLSAFALAEEREYIKHRPEYVRWPKFIAVNILLSLMYYLYISLRCDAMRCDTRVNE